MALGGWIALTGTPGVGKSAVANELRLRGVSQVEVGRLAQDHGLADEVDEARMALVVDPRRVAPLLKATTQRGQRLLLVGHWAHEVPGVTAAIVLRCRPSVLRGRLAARGWPPMKVRENLEAEAIDLITQEAVRRLGRDAVHEVDTTTASIQACATRAYKILTGAANKSRPHRPGAIDWTDELPIMG